MPLPFSITVYDANGLVKSTTSGTSGGLTSPIGISDGGTGQTSASAAFDALSPMTTEGDLIVEGAAGAERLAAGNEGDVLTIVSGVPAYAPPAGASEDYILIQDKKSQNTNGGTFSSGAWHTRDLNTEVVDTGGHASISSNQITLAAGTYRCLIRCTAYQVGKHQALLYNVSDSATIGVGTSERSATTAGTATASVIAARFTLAASKVLEVRHQCSDTGTNTGFGIPSNFTDEIYTICEFWKEA